MLMDPREGIYDVTPRDAYVDEMDMIGISHILDIAPDELKSHLFLVHFSVCFSS